MEKTLADTLLQNDFRMLELEFRVGFQTSRGFHASLPKIAWTQAMKKLEKLEKGKEAIIVDKYVSTRGGCSSRHVQTADSAYWEHKQKVSNDVTPGKFAIRTSLALETKRQGAPPNSYSLQRTKHRTSFPKGPWQIDFTRVETIPNKDDIEETYELEVELKDVGYLFEKELNLVIAEGIALAQQIIM
jgi:hypothetical protein